MVHVSLKWAVVEKFLRRKSEFDNTILYLDSYSLKIKAKDNVMSPRRGSFQEFGSIRVNISSRKCKKYPLPHHFSNSLGVALAFIKAHNTFCFLTNPANFEKLLTLHICVWLHYQQLKLVFTLGSDRK